MSYATQAGARTGATIWRAVAPDVAKRIDPDGVIDLLWFRGRLVVAGPDTRTSEVPTRPGEVTWGLQLAPGVAHTLLRVPASELTDRRVDLADLVPVPHHDRDSFEVDAADALDRMFGALWQRIEPDRELLLTAGALDRAARAGRTVTDTAAQLGLSPRSLQRLSNRLFGYGTKTLVQIHRLQRGLQLVRAGRSAGDAAATAGYADQSHFIRDARRLTGRTPIELTQAADGPARASVRFVQS